MVFRLVKHWRRRCELAKKLKDTRPCAICGLAPRIKLKNADMGRYCIFYGIRISKEEESDDKSDVRQNCMKDGNNFTWPVESFSPQELLEWRKNHTDWFLRRSAIKVAAFVGVVSVFLTAIGIVVN